MAKQTTRTAANDIQSLFDPKNYQDMLGTWSDYNARVTTLVVDAASKSSDVANDTAQEAFSNVRELASAKTDPADYAKAYSTFAQKQMELFMRTAQSLGGIAQHTGQQSVDVASSAGQDMGAKVASKAEEAANTTKSAASKAS